MKEIDALDSIFDVLLSDESFKPKIDQAVAVEVEKRVDAHAAQIDARAKERVKELSTKLERLKDDFTAENESFEAEKARRQKLLEVELEARKGLQKQEIDAKWEDLSRQEELVTQSLEAVAERLASNRTGYSTTFLHWSLSCGGWVLAGRQIQVKGRNRRQGLRHQCTH